MRVSNWNPQKFDVEFIRAGMDRLSKAAELIAGSARARCPVGTVSRGKGTGKRWTERIPGSLKKSIRVVRLKDSDARNVRVYAGNYEVYYAGMVEYGTAKSRPQPFLRPALNGNKENIRTVLGAK
jgi:HK97 gp10 family phage protein